MYICYIYTYSKALTTALLGLVNGPFPMEFPIEITKAIS